MKLLLLVAMTLLAGCQSLSPTRQHAPSYPPAPGLAERTREASKITHPDGRVEETERLTEKAQTPTPAGLGPASIDPQKGLNTGPGKEGDDDGPGIGAMVTFDALIWIGSVAIAIGAIVAIASFLPWTSFLLIPKWLGPAFIVGGTVLVIAPAFIHEFLDKYFGTALFVVGGIGVMVFMSWWSNKKADRVRKVQVEELANRDHALAGIATGVAVSGPAGKVVRANIKAVTNDDPVVRENVDRVLAKPEVKKEIKSLNKRPVTNLPDIAEPGEKKPTHEFNNTGSGTQNIVTTPEEVTGGLE